MDGNTNFMETIDKCFNMYDPRLKIEKLLLLADRGVKRTTSLNAACRLIKLGDNGVLLKMVKSKYNLDYDDDEVWLKRADKRFLRRKNSLESFLVLEQRQEARRKFHRLLGELHYDCGNLKEAFTSFHNELLVCAFEKHLIDSHLSLILVSLKRGQFEDVLEWVYKVRKQYAIESIVTAKVTCASALANMGLGKYEMAASEFLGVDCSGLGYAFNEVILPRDVAIYGGLCALATYDRSKIKQEILDNNDAWRVLGFAPEIRKVITEFHKGHYSYCLTYLQSIKSHVLLDIYLHSHVETLFDQIREKALCDYVHPFASLRMETMAQEFNSDLFDLEKELGALITDNKLQARIDSHSKVLYRRC